MKELKNSKKIQLTAQINNFKELGRENRALHKGETITSSFFWFQQ